MTVSRLEEVGGAYAPDGAPGGPAERPSAFVIDKGIPLPRCYRHNVKYPWHALKKGDSFVFPMRGDARKTRKLANASCTERRKRHGERYIVRTVVENGQCIVRVWRAE